MSSGFKMALLVIFVLAGAGFYFLLSPPSNKLSPAEEAAAQAQAKLNHVTPRAPK